MTLPRTITKFGPQQNQANYTSFERLLLELYKNVLFIKFEPLCQKLQAFMSNFRLFYHANSQNMVKSSDSN